MTHNMKKVAAGIAGMIAALAAPGAQAFTFDSEGVRGSFDTQLSVGAGMRVKGPACGLVTAGATGDGAPAGCLSPTAGVGDQGDLNYARGDLFTGYLKGSHELLLKFPQDVTAMARVNWVRDFAATRTTGIQSATTPPG